MPKDIQVSFYHSRLTYPMKNVYCLAPFVTLVPNLNSWRGGSGESVLESEHCSRLFIFMSWKVLRDDVLLAGSCKGAEDARPICHISYIYTYSNCEVNMLNLTIVANAMWNWKWCEMCWWLLMNHHGCLIRTFSDGSLAASCPLYIFHFLPGFWGWSTSSRLAWPDSVNHILDHQSVLRKCHLSLSYNFGWCMSRLSYLDCEYETLPTTTPKTSIVQQSQTVYSLVNSPCSGHTWRVIRLFYFLHFYQSNEPSVIRV